jgi:hypothetical protein
MKLWTGTTLCIFFVLLFVVGNFILVNKFVYFTKYNISYWQKEFSFSQVAKSKPEHFLSDYELYSIVGYKYWLGQNPMEMHPEVPPLGKYLVGLGIVLFENNSIMNLVLGLACLLFVYLLAKETTESSGVALLSVLLLSVDQLFVEHLTTANIDIPQLLFLLISLWAFNRKNYILASVGMGLMMGTKFYLNGLILMGVYFLYLLIMQEFRPFMLYVLSLPFLVIAYLVTYTYSFYLGTGFWEFIKFQRWLGDWWAGNARVPWGGILEVIFIGKWHTWWDGSKYIPVPNWSVLWPITMIGGIFGLNKKTLLLWLWVLTYLVFLTLTSPFPRYMIAILPFATILALNTLKSINRHAV